MNRVKAAVKNFFNQGFAIIDLTHTAWNGIGALFFQTMRTILAQLQTMVMGILDIVDGLVTGTFRAAVPKKPGE